ncbi:hypothetical protein [Paenibacillus qinlingensis]|uniref:Uncharacterized protein n=1 Tax=Paenibacillus qinlingensis TaxID=1837343 RepID=A0ABU1P6S2_9BACL|nr:hypothetical protein [Paenibacillus qinlingensis]MDR6555460.1 hypothetical protein [Paenibacillus qinlingensis]
MMTIYHRGKLLSRAWDYEDLREKLEKYRCWFTPLEVRYDR